MKNLLARAGHVLLDLAWVPTLLVVLVLIMLRGALPPRRPTANPTPRIID